MGIEPTTPCLQSRCSSQLSYVPEVASWAVHRNLWVRRASAVTLVKLAARGLALDTAYGVASALQGDSHDLIHKAAGWLLREAGRTDARRLERYLLAQGPLAALPAVPVATWAR